MSTRDDADEAQAAFEAMSDNEWSALWSQGEQGIAGLTEAERQGLELAIATRVRRQREQVAP